MRPGDVGLGTGTPRSTASKTYLERRANHTLAAPPWSTFGGPTSTRTPLLGSPLKQGPSSTTNSSRKNPSLTKEESSHLPPRLFSTRCARTFRTAVDALKGGLSGLVPDEGHRSPMITARSTKGAYVGPETAWDTGQSTDIGHSLRWSI